MDRVQPGMRSNAPAAPAPSQPGGGMGNIPFAPGMNSGKFNGPPAPPARMTAPPMSVRPGPGNPGNPTGPGGGPPGGGGPPPGGGPPGAPQQMIGSGNIFDPMLLFQMAGVYFQALADAANNGKGSFF